MTQRDQKHHAFFCSMCKNLHAHTIAWQRRSRHRGYSRCRLCIWGWRYRNFGGRGPKTGAAMAAPAAPVAPARKGLLNWKLCKSRCRLWDRSAMHLQVVWANPLHSTTSTNHTVATREFWGFSRLTVHNMMYAMHGYVPPTVRWPGNDYQYYSVQSAVSAVRKPESPLVGSFFVQ